jgi:hypothetical protein
MTECEDAYWVGPERGDFGDYDPRTLRVIVADGASESMLAGRWASHLVRVFGTAPENLGTKDGFIAAYQRAADSWGAEVARYMLERADRNSPIQWYEEPGLARGAHSTLLVVEFNSESDGEGVRWTALALGDSCMFQVRGEDLWCAFPMKSSDDFSNQPPLLSSNGTDAEVLSQHLNIQAGDLAPEDTCYMATDALSAWFLGTVESRDQPWRPLRMLDETAQGEFLELIETLRYDGKIRDDDTTLVRVDVW